MKISAFVFPLTVVFVNMLSAESIHGQNIYQTEIRLTLRNQPLREALQRIEKASGFRISYALANIAAQPRVSLPPGVHSVDQALKIILSGTGLVYREAEHKSILVYRPPSPPAPPAAPQTESPAPEAPIRKIRGRVTDRQGEALPGVNILVKGTSRGTTTDATGTFEIDVADTPAVLVFSFVGYQSLEVAATNESFLEVTLQADNRSLEEVLVIGYGTVRKSDLTGSVARVGEKEIKATPAASLDKALQGRAAGVLVTQNSARPGGESTIRIRGTGSAFAGNDPLYVVDGYPTESIGSINPADIESIEILKDASATAIYGSRGSNGVIMISTKRGKEGHSSVDFESYYGIQSVRRKIPLLNAREYAELVNEAFVNGGGAPYFDGSAPERPLPGSLSEGTDWQDEVFRHAPIQSYQLSLTGGEHKTRYAISGNIYDQKGIVLNSYFKRYTLRANIDRDLSKNIQVGLSFQASHSRSNAARTETEGGGSSGVTNAALNFAPVFPVYTATGAYYRDQSVLNGNLVDNPVGIAREITDYATGTRLLANFFGEFSLGKTLRFRTSWGADLHNGRNSFYVTRRIGLGAGSNGQAAINASSAVNWLNENTLNFTPAWSEKHVFNALAGYTAQGTSADFVQANALNFNDDFALYHNLRAGNTLAAPDSGIDEWALISYLARVNYSFDNRFLITLTARHDGSSRFGPNRKYGFFPSGAVAWKVINEAFMRKQQIVSDLKLRASFGLTGNQAIGNYGYSSLINNVVYPFGGPSPVLHTGGIPNRVSNLDLSWEKNAQTDIGLDLGLWGNRLQFTLDYYRKKTTDLLFEVNIPLTTGYDISFRNIGQIENRGIEVGLNSINLRSETLEWFTDFNIAFNRNRLLALDGRNKFITGAGSGHLQVFGTILMEVGQPIGNFYGRKTEGIFRNEAEVAASAQPNAKPGDIRYADLNHDALVNDLDRTVIGNGNPRFFGGLNNTVKFRGFELNVFLQGSYGNEILNFARFDLYNLNGNNNQARETRNRWRPDNPDGSLPRANSQAGQRILSDFHIEDGSYLRVRNLSLGYTFKSGRIPYLRSLKLYTSVQNWFTFTGYSGYDPEVSRFGNSAISQGMDYGGYPSAKTWLVGLNLNF